MSETPTLSSAAAAWNAGDFDTAMRACRQLVEQAPAAVDAWNLLGLSLYRLGRPDEAEAAYRSGLAVRPRADLLSNLGLLLKGQGRFNDALDSFHAAIRLNPRHADSHANLGRILRQAGNEGGAREALERAVGLNPDLPLAHSDLAGILFRQGIYDRAADHFAAYLVRSLPNLLPERLCEVVAEKPLQPLDPVLYRQALEAAGDLLAASGVPFFLCAGTALGCVRDREFLRWDKDIDLGVNEPVQREALCARLEESSEFWFDATGSAPGVRHMVSARYRDAVAIDIFFHREEGGLIVHGMGWHDFTTEWELSPFRLEPVAFAGGRYQLPSPADRYLAELYGDWRTPDPDYCGWVTGSMRGGWPVMARAYAFQDVVASLGAGRVRRAASIIRRVLPRLDGGESDRRLASAMGAFLARCG